MSENRRRPEPAALAGETWDLLVVGGGITGVGVLLEAARQGCRALLLEQRDYAWGTSSRSSKMVHGGLRYLARGDIRLTRHSLLERERLQRELPGLVARQSWLLPVRRGDFPGRWPLKAALWAYDFLAGIRDHRWLSAAEVREKVPGLDMAGLVGAMSYTDALTDDSRLVMRVLNEALAHGARACNYLEVMEISSRGAGFRVTAREPESGEEIRLRARRVINATGAWADRLSAAPPRIRPQRGSHLFVARERFPVPHCLTLPHQDDRRPVFVFPWEGATCIGTTDLDHREDLSVEPRCSPAEIDYLLRLVNRQFPELGLGRDDVVSTMAGVRPIIASGRGLDPSRERRDHAVWEGRGVVSVSGGKLTTFRLIALDALRAAGLLGDPEHARRSASREPMFDRGEPGPVALNDPLAPAPRGAGLDEVLDWVLTREQVVHLDDLMLRRTRLGNLLPKAGEEVLGQVLGKCREQLGWDEHRCAAERDRYLDLHARSYGVPPDPRQQTA